MTTDGARRQLRQRQCVVAKGTKLYHFGSQGQLLQSLTLDQNAPDLAVDTDRVWVATEGRAFAFEDVQSPRRAPSGRTRQEPRPPATTGWPD